MTRIVTGLDDDSAAKPALALTLNEMKALHATSAVLEA
jgi:hypothetical protein